MWCEVFPVVLLTESIINACNLVQPHVRCLGCNWSSSYNLCSVFMNKAHLKTFCKAFFSSHPNNWSFFLHLVFQLEHERVWDMWHYTQVHLRAVTQQWHQDYKELLNRALVTLEEANHAHQEELKLQKDHKHQRDVCLQLRKKVCVWNCHTLNLKISFLRYGSMPSATINLCRDWPCHLNMIPFAVYPE